MSANRKSSNEDMWGADASYEIEKKTFNHSKRLDLLNDLSSDSASLLILTFIASFPKHSSTSIKKTVSLSKPDSRL